VTTVGSGDLFLEDLRAWREKNLATLDMKGVFPLWKRNTSVLAGEIIDMGFRARLLCVEAKVGPGFVGRSYDRALLRDLPADVDPCGENGEFQSYVHDGPIFRSPVAIEVGQIVVRDGRYYADLLPAGAGETAPVAEASAIPPVT
jgi:diphthamide synthase (EF-2-diphthine--ammonia ligase)